MSTPATRSLLIDPSQEDGVVVAATGKTSNIYVHGDESPAVIRAVADLAHDIATITGATVKIDSSPSAASIVVGTIGVSPSIDAAVASGALDASALRDGDGLVRWEGLLITIVGDVLYLVGSDRRGTIYAVYEFARSIGVSPWQWWADTPVRRRDEVVVARSTHRVDWPSVRYRGIFINDEEELANWARRHNAEDAIGPQTYRRLFELILRLGGNYIWPAMHVGAFNADPINGSLAHDMGVIVGSSHCDILLRNNNREFAAWSAQQPTPVDYDYSLPGANRDALRDYWRHSVEQNGDYEVTWTVGIRGVHDSGFETKAIDADTTLDNAGRLSARVALLETAIEDQRTILESTLGVSADRAPQLFIPYKEVLPLYDAGLRVPDDVTVVWANDNFGYIRRFPSGPELDRSGGHGLYYHSSYWSNYTTSYLASSSTPLTLMQAELSKAWERGIRQLWVDNVGGLKPLEIETEFFLRCAWQAGRQSSTANVANFVAEWIDDTFSGRLGGRAADIYERYYQLNNQRKYEHLSADVFPQIGEGDEAGRRLQALRGIFEETNMLMSELPEDEHDAFFQVFAIKIHMAYFVAAEFYYADRSTLAATQGRHAASDEHVATARGFGDLRRRVIDFYNREMSGGRWDGIFTPESFPPPVMPLYPAGTPALRIAGEGLNAIVWGAASPDVRRLEFDAVGRTQKWIDVFATGRPGVPFQIDADGWLDVSPRQGVVSGERRIAVRLIGEPAALTGRVGTVTITSPGAEPIEIAVGVRGSTVESSFRGWVETEGAISIDPAATMTNAVSAWTTVPGLGRYRNGALQARSTRAGAVGGVPVSYAFHLDTAGAHVLELHRLPTLDSTGRIRVGVSVDGGAPSVVESHSTDEHRGQWSTGVQDNVERLSLRLPELDAGEHTLSLHAIDPWVVLMKLVVYTRPAEPTNLGPETTPFPRSLFGDSADSDPSAPVLVAAQSALDLVCRGAERVLPLPDQLYATADFWSGDTTNRHPIAVSQTKAGDPVVHAETDGEKDRTRALAEAPLVEADGVVAFETEDALANSAFAWGTPGAGGETWSHTQAETAARTGLAMHVRPRGSAWSNASEAPAMHYAIDATTSGTYHVWLLLCFQDDRDDSCFVGLDGVIQPIEEQFSSGALCTYGVRQAWVWAHLSDLDIETGRHTFSLYARESGLRIDRVYLTTGDELPPVDAEWRASARRATADLAVSTTASVA